MEEANESFYRFKMTPPLLTSQCVGGVRQNRFWSVWRGWWNDGDCDVGLYNEVVECWDCQQMANVRGERNGECDYIRNI